MSNSAEVKPEGIETIRYSQLYLFFLFIILSLAHILDEYATLAPSYIRSSVLKEFLVEPGIEPDLASATAYFNFVSGLMIVVTAFSTIFKSWQDRVGRKPIFIISIVGMSIGTVITILAQTFSVYIIGSMLMLLFLNNDMQYQFINEEYRAERRAQMFSYVKIAGLFSLLLVPWLRDTYISETNENWRPIMYVPIIISIIVLLLSIFFLKETRAYILMKADTRKREKVNLLNTWRNMRKLPSWPQIKWIIIVTFFMSFFTGLNQSYNEVFLEQAYISEDDKNIVILWSIIFIGVAYLFQGIIADRWGRKPSYILNNLFVVLLLPLEYYTVLHGEYILAGIFQGLRIGAFWNVTDVNRFMLIENTPTRMRGNVQAIQSLLLFFIFIPLLFTQSALIGSMKHIHLVLMIFGIPSCLISAVIVYYKLEETLYNDITKIVDP